MYCAVIQMLLQIIFPFFRLANETKINTFQHVIRSQDDISLSAGVENSSRKKGRLEIQLMNAIETLDEHNFFCANNCQQLLRDFRSNVQNLPEFLEYIEPIWVEYERAYLNDEHWITFEILWYDYCFKAYVIKFCEELALSFKTVKEYLLYSNYLHSCNCIKSQ